MGSKRNKQTEARKVFGKILEQICYSHLKAFNGFALMAETVRHKIMESVSSAETSAATTK